MAKRWNNYSAAFKFQLALEAAKGQHAINELARRHGLDTTRPNKRAKPNCMSRSAYSRQELEWLKKIYPLRVKIAKP